jgi:hypothetical protein
LNAIPSIGFTSRNGFEIILEIPQMLLFLIGFVVCSVDGEAVRKIMKGYEMGSRKITLRLTMQPQCENRVVMIGKALECRYYAMTYPIRWYKLYSTMNFVNIS